MTRAAHRVSTPCSLHGISPALSRHRSQRRALCRRQLPSDGLHVCADDQVPDHIPGGSMLQMKYSEPLKSRLLLISCSGRCQSSAVATWGSSARARSEKGCQWTPALTSTASVSALQSQHSLKNGVLIGSVGVLHCIGLSPAESALSEGQILDWLLYMSCTASVSALQSQHVLKGRFLIGFCRCPALCLSQPSKLCTLSWADHLLASVAEAAVRSSEPCRVSNHSWATSSLASAAVTSTALVSALWNEQSLMCKVSTGLYCCRRKTQTPFSLCAEQVLFGYTKLIRVPQHPQTQLRHCSETNVLRDMSSADAT